MRVVGIDMRCAALQLEKGNSQITIFCCIYITNSVLPRRYPYNTIVHMNTSVGLGKLDERLCAYCEDIRYT